MLRHLVRSRFLSNVSKKDFALTLPLNTNNEKTTDKKSINVNHQNTEDDYENMFVKTPFDNVEWGGPLRGGKLLEPTRFGDWERKGRCTDW